VRVGIYGGVFNPPHHGHLVAAQEAHSQLGLDVVVWIPVGDAPHREIESDPGAEARFEMVEMATAADERCSTAAAARATRSESRSGGWSAQTA
jgi:nicotinate-nucleotide adenylyltransferase